MGESLTDLHPVLKEGKSHILESAYSLLPPNLQSIPTLLAGGGVAPSTGYMPALSACVNSQLSLFYGVRKGFLFKEEGSVHTCMFITCSLEHQATTCLRDIHN